jgi:Glycosyl hydrolase family 9
MLPCLLHTTWLKNVCLGLVVLMAPWPRRLGSHFPVRTHSRDAAPNANIDSNAGDDVHTFCGGVVAGPYSKESVTDHYPDNRIQFESAEPAVDYSASVLCALGAYASMPAGAFDHCQDVRGALVGR